MKSVENYDISIFGDNIEYTADIGAGITYRFL